MERCHDLRRQCLNYIYIAVIKHGPKPIWGGKGLSSLQFILHLEGHSGQELKAGTRGKNWSGDHGEMLLTGFLPLVVVYLLIHPRTLCLGMGLWDLPINHQSRKCPTDLPQLIWCGYHLNCGAASQITLGYANQHIWPLSTCYTNTLLLGQNSSFLVYPQYFIY